MKTIYIILSLWCVAPAMAEEIPDTCILINEVEVTGLTGKTLMKFAPSPVSVMSNAQLFHQSSTNIIDAIARQPGVSQITTGGGISKPVIRGLGYNRVVVLNDGVRQEGQQWGDEHGVEVDAQTVHSVEIIKGPASLRYGSDAMAGVVIFHSAPVLPEDSIQATATTEYQTNNGLFAYSLDMAGNKGGLLWNWRWSDKMAHAYKNPYDGYVPGSQFRERALTGMLGLSRHWGISQLKLDYYHLTPGLIEGERNPTTGNLLYKGKLKTYGHGFPYQHVYHYKAVLDNTFYLGEGSLKALFAYQQNRRKEYEEEDHPDEAGLDFQLHTLNYDLHYHFAPMSDWKLVTGVNGMWQLSLNKGEEFLIPAYYLWDVGFFATVSRDFDRWHVSGGLRWDNRHLSSERLIVDGAERFHPFFRDFSAVTGSAGVVYNITPQWNLRMNLSHGFRAPNMGELGSNGVHEGTFRYEIGSSELKPERSWQLDVGADYTSRLLIAQLSLFASRINHYIFSHQLLDNTGAVLYTDGHPTYQYTSGDARLFGGELTVELHPMRCVHWVNAFSYVHAVQLHQRHDTKYLPFTPAPKWTSDLRYDLSHEARVFAHAYLNVGLECNFRQNHYFAAYETETATPSYTLLDISAGTDIQRKGRRLATLSFTVNNLFNLAYQSHLSRLKYLDANAVTGRRGVYNMGRNISLKVAIPIL